MATQIAPTPLVKGEAAKKIYKEMQRKPTQASKKGAKILFSKFSKMVKEGSLNGSMKGIFLGWMPFLVQKPAKCWPTSKRMSAGE